METRDIRRIPPQATQLADAARRAAARRERRSRDQDFSGELAREAGLSTADGAAEEARLGDLPVAPPEDGEAGTRIDLVG